MKILSAAVVAVVGATALLVAIALLFSVPVWLLWNWLVPTIFGLKTISLFQAWGLLVLCGFLFKSSHSGLSKSE